MNPIEKTPTAQVILDSEDMRALACVGALALGRIDLCVALMTNNIKIIEPNDKTEINTRGNKPS